MEGHWCLLRRDQLPILVDPVLPHDVQLEAARFEVILDGGMFARDGHAFPCRYTRAEKG